jgi:hypothetical protein
MVKKTEAVFLWIKFICLNYQPPRARIAKNQQQSRQLSLSYIKLAVQKCTASGWRSADTDHMKDLVRLVWTAALARRVKGSESIRRELTDIVRDNRTIAITTGTFSAGPCKELHYDPDTRLNVTLSNSVAM